MWLPTKSLPEIIRRISEDSTIFMMIGRKRYYCYRNGNSADCLPDYTETGLSICAFHNEFIPFKNVTGLLSACRKTGMNVFPWVEEFIHDIERFSRESKHSLAEYEDGGQVPLHVSSWIRWTTFPECDFNLRWWTLTKQVKYKIKSCWVLKMGAFIKCM